MIVTTTSTIQGKEIIEYIDIVNGEAIMGANIVRDLFASVRDVVGGRAGAYESKLKEARHRNGRDENFRKTKMQMQLLVST